jgi:hypothetical protein
MLAGLKRLNFATIFHLSTITERMITVFWDMAARIVTRYGLDDPGRQESFLFSKRPKPALGLTQPPTQCVPGIGQPGREIVQSHISRAEVKDELVNTFAHLCAFVV